MDDQNSSKDTPDSNEQPKQPPKLTFSQHTSIGSGNLHIGTGRNNGHRNSRHENRNTVKMNPKVASAIFGIVGIAVIVLAFFMFNINQQQKQTHTATAVGEITQSDERISQTSRNSNNNDDRIRYECHLKVEYSINETETYTVSERTSNYCESDENTGSPKTVYYDPANPSEGILTDPNSAGASTAPFIAGGLGGIFLIISIVTFIRSRK